MGGFGSGRPSGSGRGTVEASRSLDVNRLHREGCLRAGWAGDWQWTHDGERVASIQLRHDGNRLVLSYRIQRHGEEWQDVEQLCRHCYRLAYASQREDRYDRALRRANNIRMRLGGKAGIAAPFPGRPKRMHNQTYERLKSAALDAEILAEERLVILLARMQRSDRRNERRSAARLKEFWR